MNQHRGSGIVDLEPIAERVMRDVHGQVPIATLISVLRECAQREPDSSPEALEHATRTQLNSPGPWCA